MQDDQNSSYICPAKSRKAMYLSYVDVVAYLNQGVDHFFHYNFVHVPALQLYGGISITLITLTQEH